MAIDPDTGLVTFTPTAAGAFEVTIEARNDFGADTQTWTLTVGEAPAITSTPPTSATVGVAYEYAAEATGTAPITWQLLAAPSGMAIDPDTGLVTFTPTAAGSFEVTIEARNDFGADTQTWTLLVTQPGPVITSTPPTEAFVGEEYTYQAEATGADPIVWTLLDGPEGMTIDANTGLVTFLPVQAGTFPVSIQAENPFDSDRQDYDLVVTVFQARIVINEIMYNPDAVADEAGEYIELFNPTTRAIDLNGWEISDNGIDVHVIDDPLPVLIPPLGFLVLGRNGDVNLNGGVEVDYVYDNFILANGPDEIFLKNPNNDLIDEVHYLSDDTWPQARPGFAIELLSPTLDNDLGASWRESEVVYGAGDHGTPGRINDVTP
ncbi:MAG: lamin tail domain-containing protein [Deltaproteobacteria bacterium]|nr:MAG: lamin tail domain-containing protein [Deltaproteobacteria bacterium]